jgi:hypothetical protein
VLNELRSNGIFLNGRSFSGTLGCSHCQVIIRARLSSQRISPSHALVAVAIHRVAGANRVCEIPSAVRMFCSKTKRHFLTPTNLSTSEEVAMED